MLPEENVTCPDCGWEGPPEHRGKCPVCGRSGLIHSVSESVTGAGSGKVTGEQERETVQRNPWATGVRLGVMFAPLVAGLVWPGMLPTVVGAILTLPGYRLGRIAEKTVLERWTF